MCTYIYIPVSSFKAVTEFSFVHNAELDYLHAGSLS